MFERFTDKARAVILDSQEEARKFGGGYVSTEHLLLGLIRDPTSFGACTLEKSGINLIRIRREVEKQLPCGDSLSSQGVILAPRAKRVIDRAYEEARLLNNNHIHTGHLLLGLIREVDGLAARVLTKLGLELESCRKVLAGIQAEVPAKPQVILSGTDWRAVCTEEEGVMGTIYTCKVYPLATIHLKDGRTRKVINGHASLLDDRTLHTRLDVVDLGILFRELGGQVVGFPEYQPRVTARQKFESEYLAQPPAEGK